MKRGLVALSLIVLAGAGVSAFRDSSFVTGHRGRREDQALLVRVRPDRQRSGVPSRHDDRVDTSYLTIEPGLKNLSDHTVQLGSCHIVALDSDHHLLFQIPQPFVSMSLRFPGTILAPRAVPERAYWSGVHADPRGVRLGTRRLLDRPLSAKEVRAVDSYRASCVAYRWVGQLPPVPDEEFG